MLILDFAKCSLKQAVLHFGDVFFVVVLLVTIVMFIQGFAS